MARKCADQHDLIGLLYSKNTFSGIFHNAYCSSLFLAAQKGSTINSIFSVLWGAMVIKNNFTALKIPVSINTGDLPIHAAIREGQWVLTATTLVAQYSYEQLTTIKNKDGKQP